MSDPNDNDDFHKQAEPVMAAIGYVAHHWSRLEHQINEMIWALAAVEPPDGACITAQIPSIVPRMRSLIALADNHGASKELIKDLNRFSGIVDGLARRRNRVIHDPWFFREYSLPDDHKLFELGQLEITADRRLVYEIKPKNRKDLLDLTHEILGASGEFMILRTRLHDELKERLESRLGKPLEDFLDYRGPDNET